MLPSQFSPLNYFGIDGDILRVDHLIHSGYGDKPNEISFYNINPTKIYDQDGIDFNTNFYDNGLIKNINFYNFNQDELTLLLSSPSVFYRCNSLLKLNFNGTIVLKLSADNSREVNGFFFETKNLNFSNIKLIIDTTGLDPYSADNTFYQSNIFGRYNKEGTIKEANYDFVYNISLNYTFFDSLQETLSVDFIHLISPNYENNHPGVTNPDLSATDIDGICSSYINIIIDYSKIKNKFFTTEKFIYLKRAYNAFSKLKLHKEDVKTLANNLPTYTDGGQYGVGVGLYDSTVTEQELTEIQSMYTDKGWTLSLNQITD